MGRLAGDRLRQKTPNASPRLLVSATVRAPIRSTIRPTNGALAASASAAASVAEDAALRLQPNSVATGLRKMPVE
jgi:hypothetical protein